MILNIIKYPNPLLRKKAKKVKKVDKKIKDLIKNMFETVKNAPGVGLAAPQVGESLQIIVVNLEKDQFALINPIINKKSKEIHIFEEGCLSVPGLVGIVERPKKIVVEALDKNGKKIKIEER
jgi:peptide deformylase